MPSVKQFLVTFVAIAVAMATDAHRGQVEPRREVFYVGGEYQNITLGNTTKQYMVNQIYVEKLTPPTNPEYNQPYPIVFVAGAGQTGTNWLETPDGRPGWASFFLSQGYTLYLTDQPARGRSPWNPATGNMTEFSTSDIELQFTATQEHELWPQSKLHTQWPGSGKVGDPIFDAFFATQTQYNPDRPSSEEANAKAYPALLDKIGEAYVITHSQSGAYGWRIGDARPKLVKGIIALEPTGPPFELKFPFSGPARAWGITDGPITYEPDAGPNGTLLETVRMPAKDVNHTDYLLQKEPAKKLINLVKVPVLVVTGEASYHQPYDYATVEYLRQGGVERVDYLDLGKEGIHGNGHMIFMEKNNLEVAELVLKWLKQH